MYDWAKFADISTEQVKKDISSTEKEIDQLSDELIVLNKNPRENKLKIYMIRGHLLQRNDFVDKLNMLLEYRNE